MIELVPQAVAGPEPAAAPAPAPTPQPEPADGPVAAPPAPEPPAPKPAVANAHLLFLPGYTLEARRGSVPACGSSVEHEGRAYTVLRHGPSPLPADDRRCAYLELS